MEDRKSQDEIEGISKILARILVVPEQTRPLLHEAVQRDLVGCSGFAAIPGTGIAGTMSGGVLGGIALGEASGNAGRWPEGRRSDGNCRVISENWPWRRL
jgi:hypothetical protein